MTREQYLLTKVMEEAAEVSHRAAKALLFGLEEVQLDSVENPDGLDNTERLLREFNDLYAVLEMLLGTTVLTLKDWRDSKRMKVERYMLYSKQLGILDKT